MKNLEIFTWWKFVLKINRDLEESCLWKFEDLGIKRVAIERKNSGTSDSLIMAWLPTCDWQKDEIDNLYSKFIPLSSVFGDKLTPPTISQLKDEDWNNAWKQFWLPDPVGSNFLILPKWLSIPSDHSSRCILRIDPGSAFGTGSHPTTRLCIEAIERAQLSDKKVADLGCGSGILSLASIKKGAEKVFAVDTDSLAISSAKSNAILNNIDKDKLIIKLGSIDSIFDSSNGEKVDYILCNILLPIIKELAPKFSNILSPNGKAIISGILVNQVHELEMILEDLEYRIVNSYQKNGWSLLEIKGI